MDGYSNLITAYNSIPYDLSGSTSKNRFRHEVFWGISKMFDLYAESEFCVVFDYKCDIEIHLKDSLEFYQVKTHKIQSPYTFAEITKRDKKTGKSILGKLYLLKSYSGATIEIKLALVSNAFFKMQGKIYAEGAALKFSDLKPKEQDKIKEVLKDEINADNIDITNIHFIYTSMNLLAPEADLIGKITQSFVSIKGEEPIKPLALSRLIIDTANEKACYELAEQDYNELINRKGMTKNELTTMLDRHMERVDDCIEKTKLFIENSNQGVRATKRLKAALIKVCGELLTSKELIAKESEMAKYLVAHTDELPDSIEEIVGVLVDIFRNSFSIEYSKEQIYVLSVLIAKRWEDNRYE